MSRPVMAPVTEITVTVSRPCILMIDDDEKFLERAEEFFRELGYNVDTARTPEKTEPLLKLNKYQLVASDINFSDLSRTQGDKFVTENRPLFGKAKRVLISAGTWLTQERRDHLNRAGVSFVEKTSHLNERLAAITQQEEDTWAKDIENVVTSGAVPGIERITGGTVKFKFADATPTGAATGAATGLAPHPVRSLSAIATNKMKQAIINWLKSRGDLDEPVFGYGKEVYSANQMIGEVEGETEVGLEHIEMLLEEFKHSLEVDVDDPQHYDDDEP